jgi:hypothetical protein
MMGLTLRKRFTIIPGHLYVNVGLKSFSVTTRVAGVSHTRSSTGRRTTSANLPGPFGWRHNHRRDHG